MAFSSDVVSIERNGAVATLWLDRPEKRNALNQALWGVIPDALRAIEADPEARVVVLAGRGKSFCVGLDLVESAGIGGGGGDAPSQATANLRQLEVTRRFQAAVSSLAECALPVIAAVHGHCLGAGIDLITACDIRVAAADASFGVRETRIGLVADVGTLQRLPKIVNAGHTAELAYTGRDIDAARAEKIGLINDVYADFDATYAAAQDLANEIAANSPLAVRGTKYILQQDEDLTTNQSLTLNGLYTLMTSLQSNDLREAMQAFIEKRPPKFTGS